MNKSHVIGWDDRRFYNHIMKALRSASYKSPNRAAVLKEAYVGKRPSPTTRRMCQWYRCACCEFEFMRNEIEVDHIQPVVPVTGWVSWDDTIDRLFCHTDGLQVLCKDCHHHKSSEENAKRPKKPKKKPVPRMRPTK